MAVKSEAEHALWADLVEAGYPPVIGHAFHDLRGWEFDLSYPQLKLAIEIDGRGRHQRPQGERRDCEKQNAAVEQGWRVMRLPAASVTTHKRRARIVEQIGRIVCGVESPEDAACVLTGD